MLQTQVPKIWIALGLVHAPVPGMDVLCHRRSLIFKRVKGIVVFILFVFWSEQLCRQINVDYSICKALQYHSQGITSALVIYDVACQWSKKFEARVENARFLHIPPAMETIPAVGKFHLNAHKLSCYPRFSLNYVEGAGHVDGEILETLWAPLNKIAPSARSMSAAFRQETYDAHMQDSNWKKLLQLGAFYFYSAV